MKDKFFKLMVVSFIIAILVVIFNCPFTDENLNGDDDQTVRVEMVSVTGGTFTMGSTAIGFESIPEHSVTVSSLYMSKYEITNKSVVDVFNWANTQGKITANADTATNNEGDKQELLNLNGSSCHIEYSSGTFSVKTGLGDDGSGGSVDLSNYPCIEISWYGAVAYCNYLSEKEGLAICYNLSDWSLTISNNGYRLPTEAEFEYAARYIDGDTWRAGDNYSGSNNIENVAWYTDNSGTTPHSNIIPGKGTHKVGLKTVNDPGIYDMSGNVWEWCHDWWYYTDSNNNYYKDCLDNPPTNDPTGHSSGLNRVIRGGGWGNPADSSRVAYRNNVTPSSTYYNIGFRVARTL